MEDKICLDWLERSLAFLRDILDSPEKLAWCREFSDSVPKDFQAEVGEFLLGYRESGAEKACRDAIGSLDSESVRLSAGEELKEMSDAELEGRLAGLMDGDSPFVLYGMSSGLLYRLFDELLSRRKKGSFRFMPTPPSLRAWRLPCKGRAPAHWSSSGQARRRSRPRT